ncbi:hypothetical protein LCGC14_3028960 [marine sediment metagenome]|uniref:Peptide deformylase n=1 Tax=marine sediment metagenome TaxID=412755 RepID=A0A0F8Z0T3_9ZZZZ
MVKRKIIVYPDPVLSLVSEEVTEIDEETQELIKDMFEAMDEEVGIGLAAPQLGVSERIMVVSIKEKNYLWAVVDRSSDIHQWVHIIDVLSI